MHSLFKVVIILILSIMSVNACICAYCIYIAYDISCKLNEKNRYFKNLLNTLENNPELKKDFFMHNHSLNELIEHINNSMAAELLLSCSFYFMVFTAVLLFFIYFPRNSS